MGTAILACQTLRDELALAIKATGVDYPVIYVESGLHNTPELLHARIQQEINRIDNVDIILLVFGYCGNSLQGSWDEEFLVLGPGKAVTIHDICGGGSEQVEFKQR